METSFKRFFRLFPWALLLCFVPMLFVVRHFENLRVFDNLGTWYTISVAVFFSIPFASAAAACVTLFGPQTQKGK